MVQSLIFFVMMKRKLSFTAFTSMLLVLLGASISFSSCMQRQEKVQEPFAVEHLDWVSTATIYEVNVRQFTPEGTFNAFAQSLPRLKELGVDVLWFMPVHPIGVENRKGTLGSYYSIKDYKGTNPEFGTFDDFKAMVDEAHSLDMKVIIDWVANHTSHDAVWVTSNPEFYTRDSVGNLISPFDWTDVAELDFENKKLWDAMIDAMKYWVEEADIDGFRCDVAGEVPTEFWNKARRELDEVKPMFMLAEAEKPELQEYAFDADYGWEFHHIKNEIAKGKKTVMDLDQYVLKSESTYPRNTIKMNFTSNHDENSWNGTEFERLGEGVKAFTALTYVMPGMPLIYNGQEVGFNRRLQFFEKDLIDWTENAEMTNFYTKLNQLKEENTALAAGPDGGEVIRVKTSNDVNVFALIRRAENDEVFSIFNLSPLVQTITLQGDEFVGDYTNYLTGEAQTFTGSDTLELAPWQFFVLTK